MSRKYTAEECAEYYGDSTNNLKLRFWLLLLFVLLIGTALGVYLALNVFGSAETTVEVNCPICTDPFAGLQAQAQIKVDKINTEIESKVVIDTTIPALYITLREPLAGDCFDIIAFESDGEFFAPQTTEIYPC